MKMQNTLRTTTHALLLAGMTVLAGCTNEELALEHEYVPNSGSEQYAIIAEKGPRTLTIANGGSLTPGQINAIGSFARKAATSGTPVTISKPHGANARLTHEVANLLAQQGVSNRLIKIGSHKGSAKGPVKITYTAMHARTAPCGEWPEDMSDTRMNHLNFNHGCAVQTNIAAMVADPQDFETPTPVDQPTAATSAIAINNLDGTTLAGASTTGSGSLGGASTGGAAAPKP